MSAAEAKAAFLALLNSLEDPALLHRDQIVAISQASAAYTAACVREDRAKQQEKREASQRAIDKTRGIFDDLSSKFGTGARR